MADEKATFNDIQVEIGTKAMKDATYRNEILRDPKAVLERELRKLEPGVTIPASLEVKVHEQGPNTLHLVLPMSVTTEHEENVTNDQLGAEPLGSITNSNTFRKTFITWDCGCL